MKYYNNIVPIVFFVGLIIGFAADRLLIRDNVSVKTEVIRDTVIVVDYPAPLVIDRIKAKVRYVKDTAMEVKPFEACIDTIIRQDTVYAKYFYPENVFSLELLRKPDSTKFQTVTIFKEKAGQGKDSWWETPAAALGGVLLGMTISSLIK